MISANLDEIDYRAQNWVSVTNGLAHVIDGESMVGGGSLPGGTLPTKLVAFGVAGKGNAAFVLKLSQALRNYPIPVIGRINDNVLLLDPRSVLPEEDETVTQALSDVTNNLKQ
jgi:L-seryl-tRNA(Ser) seleniumtransferase